jgi:hypothetical protein
VYMWHTWEYDNKRSICADVVRVLADMNLQNYLLYPAIGTILVEVASVDKVAILEVAGAVRVRAIDDRALMHYPGARHCFQ